MLSFALEPLLTLTLNQHPFYIKFINNSTQTNAPPNKKPDLEDRLQAAIAVNEMDLDVSIHFLAELFGVSNTTHRPYNSMKGCSSKPAIALSS